MYTKRGNNFYGSKEDKKEERHLLQRNGHAQDKKDFAPFYKEIAVLVVFALFIFFF